mmetsp:Transcript_105195/g.327964  ORF Transcript_105195/g.327964 Transcript_105195/m.327964 type:complete len:207 (+) Transcript_105195:210-830(+)
MSCSEALSPHREAHPASTGIRKPVWSDNPRQMPSRGGTPKAEIRAQTLLIWHATSAARQDGARAGRAMSRPWHRRPRPGGAPRASRPLTSSSPPRRMTAPPPSAPWGAASRGRPPRASSRPAPPARLPSWGPARRRRGAARRGASRCRRSPAGSPARASCDWQRAGPPGALPGRTAPRGRSSGPLPRGGPAGRRSPPAPGAQTSCG